VKSPCALNPASKTEVLAAPSRSRYSRLTKTLPDFVVRIHKDSVAAPPSKYVPLQDALHWTPNLGVPGMANPAFMEIFNSSVVPKMVKGQQSPEDAAAAGAAEMQRIVDKWKQVS